mgnify:FL=1
MARLQTEAKDYTKGSERMNCDICDRKNAEHVGMLCGKHQACFHCINDLVKTAVKVKTTLEGKR